MSKLNELIAELCPDGVKYIDIGSIVSYEQPSKYIVKSTNYSNDFSIPVLTAGQSFILGYTNENENLYNASKDNPVIIFDDFTGAFKWVDFPFKIKSSAIKMLTTNDEKTTLRYIFHVMGNINYYSDEHKRLWISIYSAIKIPIPPLSVQNEIVRILDNFTELTAKLTKELTAELTARKKQYEYYRDFILNKNNNYPKKTLGDICQFVRGPFGGSLKKECFTNYGYAVYEQQHAIYGEFIFRYFINREKFEKMKRFSVSSGDLIISCSGTMGRVSIIPEDAPEGIINQALLKLTAKSGLNSKYLKYCFENTITSQLNNSAKGGAIKNVASVKILKKINICVPPLKEQCRIVAILDHFDTLCNNISTGLLAEIAARQKQYEYYRNKLLSFKEL